jgi:glutaredoxin
MQLRLYSRPGCHLCEEMKAVVERVLRSTHVDADVSEVDISKNADLEARYGLEIPVLEIDGRKIAKYRITDRDLRRAIAGTRAPA